MAFVTIQVHLLVQGRAGTELSGNRAPSNVALDKLALIQEISIPFMVL